MDPTLRGSSPTKGSASTDSPEQLLDAFKAAALSVTKLYKTSAASQTKARTDGYQDCLDDLLVFLDKQNIGLSDGEGWQIRRWATGRLEGRDAVSQTNESEDEAEKQEPAASTEPHQSTNNPLLLAPRLDPRTMRADSAPPQTSHDSHSSPVVSAQLPQITVPTQENFTFQSSMAYPQDSDLNMANLDLSDSRATDTTVTNTTAHHPNTQSRPRANRTGPRQRASNHLGRVTGQKRKINFAEIFDLGSLGGKDMFGSGGGKRSRHA